jgi:DHA2 family multidrug resistance protein
VEHVTPYDLCTAQTIDGLTGRLVTTSGLAPGVAEDSALKLLDGAVNRHAAMMAYNDVFWLMGMLFILTIPCLFLMSRGSGRSTAQTPPRAASRHEAERGDK